MIDTSNNNHIKKHKQQLNKLFEVKIPYFHHHNLLSYKHHSNFVLQIHKAIHLFNTSSLQHFRNTLKPNNSRITSYPREHQHPKSKLLILSYLYVVLIPQKMNSDLKHNVTFLEHPSQQYFAGFQSKVHLTQNLLVFSVTCPRG